MVEQFKCLKSTIESGDHFWFVFTTLGEMDKAWEQVMQILFHK